MSESFWQEPYSDLILPQGTIYAQTFTPLWSHTLERIRVYLRTSKYPTKYKVSIQYLDPSQIPTGVDLSAITITDEHKPYGAYTNTRQRKMPEVRIVKGINYAFLIETLDCWPANPPKTRYQPPPTTYTRGKLIKSVDGGLTWDLTDLGDLLFSEFGDPPLKPTPYVPPFDHWSIDDYGACDYNTSSCIRIATTSPAQLTILIAVRTPTRIDTRRIIRGVTTPCLDHYTFKVDRSYKQLEKNDSIYHTFHVKSLKKGRPYWFAFAATADFWPTPSTGPIFHKVHPGGPPFTTIRRPDAPGDLCTIPRENGEPCPDHYLNIDEATPDEDATCVINGTYSSSLKSDLYNIPNLDPLDTAPIEQVHLTIRIRASQVYHLGAVAYLLIKTHGVIYESPQIRPVPATYENFHWHVYLNPFTSLAWTPQEINDLQIGVKLNRRRGVGWGIVSYCTQVYCKIIHDCSAYE